LILGWVVSVAKEAGAAEHFVGGIGGERDGESANRLELIFRLADGVDADREGAASDDRALSRVVQTVAVARVPCSDGLSVCG
jgi:uncharacterized tellurite resistance protein B-like protein